MRAATRLRRPLFPIVALSLLLPSCRKGASGDESAPEPPRPVDRAGEDEPKESQWYRVVLSGGELGDIPFYLELPPGGSDAPAVIVHAEKRVEAQSKRSGSAVEVDFPMFHTRIEAQRQEDGSLAGSWSSESPSWGKASLPLRAVPVAAPDPARRFEFESDGPPMDLGVEKTYFRLRFPDTGAARLALSQHAPGVFSGTLSFTTGNNVYLAGNGRGALLKLSSFDGTSPYLLSVALDPETGGVDGTFAAGQSLDWKESVQGERAEGPFELERAIALAAAKDLKLPGVSRYAGKPLIVELGGSWCAACKDAASFLRTLHDRHNAQGLEILTLLYEFTDDEEYNEKQAEIFKRDYQIPWEVLPVHGTVDDYWEIIPKELEKLDVSGFPVAIFVGRDGILAGVHSGFPGSEYGELYEQTTAKYERLTRTIMGEDSE